MCVMYIYIMYNNIMYVTNVTYENVGFCILYIFEVDFILRILK